MRCPKCHKKVHKDDIYCIWCSASLRGRSPEDPWNCVCADEKTHRAHAPRKKRPAKPAARLLPFVIPALMLAILPGILLGVFSTVRTGMAEISLTPEPEPLLMPENALRLDAVIAQWDGFTVTADHIAVDATTGEVELFYTADNRTEHTVISADSVITAEGYRLDSLLYLELEPGEQYTGTFWIDTSPLQAVDISRIRELTVSLNLTDGEDYVTLADTAPVSLVLDLDLPEIPMHKGKTGLIETEAMTVTLAGWQADPEYGELTLYTLIENRSDDNGSVFMEDARCGSTDLHLYGYYDISANTKLLCRDILYDIPYAENSPTEITFSTQIQDARFRVTATGQTLIRLDPGGGSGSISGEWE